MNFELESDVILTTQSNGPSTVRLWSFFLYYVLLRCSLALHFVTLTIDLTYKGFSSRSIYFLAYPVKR